MTKNEEDTSEFNLGELKNVEELKNNHNDLLNFLKKERILDKFLGKVVSRKLLVFIVATSLLMIPESNLSSDSWAIIAMCYIGGQSAIDMVNTFRFGE